MRLLKGHLNNSIRYSLNVFSSRQWVIINPRHWLVSNMPWWRHQMETFSALLALCARNSRVTGEFPPQRQVTRSFDVFFDLRLNKRLINNREAGDLRHHRAHYDVTVMPFAITWSTDDGCWMTQITRGPLYEWLFHCNSNSMKISLCSHTSYAVVACAKFCSDTMPNNGVTLKQISIELQSRWNNRWWNGPRALFDRTVQNM